MKALCIKSLYKSTYKNNAFSNGKLYEIIKSDDEFVYIKDNEGCDFNFSKDQSDHYYNFDKYFTKA